MARYEDLTGRRFGRLVVLEPTEQKNKDGRRIWKCLCDCGNIKYTSCQNLKRGDCTSCGCKNKEQITKLGQNHGFNLIGKRYGQLTVVSRANKLDYSNSIAWNCQCDCGNMIVATTSSLNSGNTTSCGKHKSKGEYLIQQILINNNIKFETEKTISGLNSVNNRPLRFDFYLPDYNILIEFDGEQHYKQSGYTTADGLYRDMQKNEYCLSHNIKLFRIPYSDISLLESYLFQDLFQDKYLVKKINHYNISY